MRSRSCKLQMSSMSAFVLWGSLLLFQRKIRLHYGSKSLVVNIRIGTLLMITSIACVLASLGELIFSLSDIASSELKWTFFGVLTWVRVAALIFFNYFMR